LFKSEKNSLKTLLYPLAFHYVIERAFREVRRRTRPMSCFNHDQSIERIVYAVLNHLNEQWGKKPLKEFTQKS
jgi:transposase-like protein